MKNEFASKVQLDDFKTIPYRELEKTDKSESQINIFLSRDMKTKLKLLAIKNGTSVRGLTIRLYDMLIQEAESKLSL
tara:strand:+ start:73 stop:303 length:231 start_codon:yes stop_codon:yes gene_type:complete